jgi:hypothetical protein
MGNINKNIYNNKNGSTSLNKIISPYLNIHGICTKSGNNYLLTHQSYNKNMCMFFRRRLGYN